MPQNINGKHCYIDQATGEYFETDGGTFYSNEDKEKAKRAKEALYHKELRRSQAGKQGGFVLMKRTRLNNKISPQILGRLAYLSVYSEYDTGRLMLSERTIMKSEDSKEILGISQRNVYDFLKECQESALLTLKENGEMILSDYFIKGRSKFQKQIRLYIDPVKSLYQKMIQSEQNIRYFGYIIQLVPYINKEWNVICCNPNERSPHKLEPMNIEEICSLLNFNPTNSGRLTRVLKKITFIGYDLFENERREQKLCNFIKDSESNEWRIIINPNVLFMGTDPTKIEGYLQFFPNKAIGIS